MVALAMPTYLPSRIDAVTVYRHGAQITRVVTIADAATCGDVIRVGGLPLSLEERSVRVQLSGSGLVAADVRLGLDVGVAEPGLAPAESEALRGARRTLALLVDRRRHIEAQRRRLSETIEVLRPAGKEGERPPPSPYRGRRAVVEFQREALEELDSAGESLAVELRRAQEDLAELEARDRAATSARQAKSHEMRRTAEIRLERRPGATGSRELRIEYTVPGARWAPAYTVTLDKGMSRATLALRAVVAQRTGEDWGRVKLTLSTADRQRWTELPELHSMRIGRRQPTPARRGWRPPPVGGEALYADYDRFARAHLGVQDSASASAVDMVADLDDEFDEVFALEEVAEASYDGYAPPAEAPVPQARGRRDMHKERKKRSPAKPSAKAVFGGATRGAPPAPSMPPPPGAMPMRSSLMASSANSLVQAGGGGSMDTGAYGLLRDEPEPVEAREDPSALLAYAELRMPDAAAPGRGKLVAVSREERIRELIVVRESTLIETVIGEIETARSGATVRGSLPSGHAFPASVEGFDYSYLAEGPVDVDADGDFHGIPLLARDGEVELGHVVVPRESTDVFRVVTLKNPLQAPLLAGPADVYVGGDYLLTCDLGLAPIGGELSLGLGVEQAIKVSRNATYAEESAGLIGGSLLLKHQIAVEVNNRLDRAVAVEVRERVPSLAEGEDEIHLEVASAVPRWEPYEPEEYTLRGGHRWRFEIAGGARQHLRAAYTVKISAKRELVGGNRREV